MPSTVRARFVVCVLGRWSEWRAVDALVTRVAKTGFERDREYSRLEPDPRMKKAFDASHDRVVPSLTGEDQAAIAEHASVGYFLSPPIEPARARQVAETMLRLVVALLDAGGLAAKCESSGIAHGAARWRALAAGDDRPESLYQAWVRRPIADDRMLYSCGMHLLGEPDAEITRRSSKGGTQALDWIDELNLYVLREKPARGMKDGEGFRRFGGRARRVLRVVPCERYPDDDFFFNPHGYLRLTTPRAE
jgi:hypothetical protein